MSIQLATNQDTNPMPDKAKATKKTPKPHVAQSIFVAPLTPAPKSERAPLKG